MSLKIFEAVLLIIIFSSVIVGATYYTGYLNSKQEPKTTEQSVALDWACMDGCFDMLEVIYGDINSDNSILKDYHTECTNICHEKYLFED